MNKTSIYIVFVILS